MNMECPKCGSDESVKVDLYREVSYCTAYLQGPEGDVYDTKHQEVEEWGAHESADCTCESCGHTGTPKEFNIPLFDSVIVLARPDID